MNAERKKPPKRAHDLTAIAVASGKPGDEEVLDANAWPEYRRRLKEMTARAKGDWESYRLSARKISESARLQLRVDATVERAVRRTRTEQGRSAALKGGRGRPKEDSIAAAWITKRNESIRAAREKGKSLQWIADHHFASEGG